MIGIDHNLAPLDIRALFSFTKKSAGEAMEEISQLDGISGCVILSTCNRMELWVSAQEEWDENLYDLLCKVKQIAGDDYRSYFVEREGQEAVEHLFYLAGGLKSQIIGEDQILTQVKDALGLAREHYVTDNVLEVLFRMAATVGKKIKTQVVFPHGSPSVIRQALEFLEEQENYEVRGRKCLVIGNGEMGKLTAQTLREAGADVTVTVRQYRSGVVQIPLGCNRIDYGERMTLLPACDLVVSATASPNWTLPKDLVEKANLRHSMIFIDLAVPRDIDPDVAQISGITLYDMDSFHLSQVGPEMEESLEQAAACVQQQMEEFLHWYEGKDLFPRIEEIKAEAVNDLNLRINKIMKAVPISDKEQQELQGKIDQAASKVVNKMIFGLRDCLEQDTFEECVAGLEKIYEES